MTATLVALMDGCVVGSVTRRRGGALVFRYEDDYRGTPLSVSMPTAISEHADRVISPWLAGLLPDNEAVLSQWSRQFRVSPSPFALLGTPVGHDCAGAVQFARPDHLNAILDRTGDVEWLTERQLADRLRLLVRDRTAWLGSEPTGQFSLAGAQAKIALRFDGDRWGVPTGAAPTTHILQPALNGLDDHEVNEHLCLLAARTLGLPTARTSIIQLEDQSALVVARYDRVSRDGVVMRVHQEDLCQALSVHPSAKYESEGGPGVRSVFGLLRITMPSGPAEQAASRVIDALIFNWLIGGTDAHAKNYSLLLSGDAVRLAPLYDIASALPYPGMHERRLKFAMRLGRDYEVWPHHDPWPGVASDSGLRAEYLRSRVDELSSCCSDAFADAAHELVREGIASPMLSSLPDRVAERVRRCRRVMALSEGVTP